MANSTSSPIRKSIAVESVTRNVVKAEQGSHYVLKGAEGAFWDECLAVRSGDDLIVRFADGTVLVLDGFFAVGAAVELPAENGTYQVLDAEAYVDTGSPVVHAVGDASTLSSLAAYDSAIADYVEAVLSAGESLPSAGGYVGGVENLFGVLGAAGGLGLAAAGAGGGGGSSGSFAPGQINPGQVNPGQSGVVVDGYIKGATVRRANGSGEAVETDENGRFEGLTGTGDIVVAGGIDVSTDQPFTGQLRAPADAAVVTPLTTLVAELEDQGLSREDAIERVQSAFSLSAEFAILDKDPYAAAQSGDAQALEVLKAGVQVATLLQAVAGTEAGFEAGAKALADKVNVAGFDSTVFFADADELQSLVDDIVGSLPGTDVNSDFDAASAALQFGDMAKAQNAAELADTQAIALIEQAPDRFNVPVGDENAPVGGGVPIARLTVTPGSTLATEAEAIEGAVRVLGVEGAEVTVTFTGQDGEVVKLLTGDGKAQHVSLTEADLAELGEGQITVSAIQTLDGVRQTGAPAIRSFTLDTIAPEAPALALAEDTGTFAGITSKGDVAVNGLEDGAAWEYSLDGGDSWAPGTGNTIAASVLGSDGAKSVQVRQTDLAGNVSVSSEVLDFTVNTAAPTLRITDNVPGVSKGLVLFTFSFSEDVVGFDASKIDVAGGVAGSFAAVNGSTYTLVVTPTTTPNAGDVTVSVAAGAVSDLAGNALADGVSASQAYFFEQAIDPETDEPIVDPDTGAPVGQAPEVDETAPTLRITDNVSGVASGPVVFTFSFSEDVVGFDASKIDVAGGVAGSFAAVNGSTYTLVVTPSTTPNAGDVTVSVAAGAVSDLAGNALADGVSASQAYEFEVAKDEDGNEIVAKDEDGNDLQDADGNPIFEGQAPEVDETAPTLRITDNVPGVSKGLVLFTFSFSEDVVGFDASKIDVAGGVAGAFAAVNGSTYTLVVTPSTTPNAGDVTVSVAAGAVSDLAGNALADGVSASQAYEFEVAKDEDGNEIVAKDEDGNDLQDADGNPIFEGQAPEVDETAPTLRITDNVSGVASGPVVFTFSFSEDVVGFDASKIDVAGGVAGAFAAVNGSTYTLVVTPSTTPNAGDVTVSVAAGAVSDLAGNALADGVSASQAYFFEQAIDPETNQPIVDPETNEPVGQAPEVDETAPTLRITDNVSGVASGPVVFTFSFSEDVVGFDASKIDVAGGVAGSFAAVNGSTYTLVVTPSTTPNAGDVTVSVAAGAVSDLAGNKLSDGVSASQAYEFEVAKDEDGNEIVAKDEDGNDLQDADGNPIFEGQAPEVDETAPTLRITDNVSGVASGPVVFTFSFSEDVVGFDASKIDVAGGVAGAFAAVNGSTYTLVVTPSTTPNAGDVTVSVAAGAVSDLAGNALADGVSASQAYFFEQAIDPETNQPIVDPETNEPVGQAPEVDETAPTLRITDNVSGVASGPVVFTFSFSEDVVGFDASKITVEGGVAGTFNAVSGNTYTLVVTPNTEPNIGNVSVTVIEGAASDLTGNALASPVTATRDYFFEQETDDQTGETRVLVAEPDATAPTLNITSSADGTATGPVTFTFVFNEDVTDFDISDVQIAGGSASSQLVSVNARTYTLEVTPNQENVTGEMSVSVSTGAARDLAGNLLQESASLSQDYDLAPPAPTLRLAEDTGNSNTDSITTNGQVMVDGLIATARWEYKVGEGEWTTGEGNSFILEATGEQTVQVRQTNTLGEHVSAESAALTFTLVEQPSQVVTLTAEDTVSGQSINSQSIELRGTISADLTTGQVVKVYNGSQFLADAEVTGTNWTLSVAGLSLGVSNFTARVEEAAGGHVSASSDPFVINAMGENAVTITSLTDAQGNAITGDEAATLDTRPTLRGRLSTALAEGETLVIHNTAGGDPVLLGQANVIGSSWSFRPSTPLAAGEYTFSATVQLGENTLFSSFDAITVTAQGTAPDQQITELLATHQVDGEPKALESGQSTAETSITLIGRLSAGLNDGDQLVIYRGTTRLSTAIVTEETGEFTFSYTTPALAVGDRILTARVENPITGNGPRSQPFVAKINSVAIDTVVADSGDNVGLVGPGETTDDTTPVISGTLGAALAADESVTIFSGNDILGTATVNGTSWTFAVPENNALDFGAASLTAQIVTMQDDDVVDTLITSTVREVDVVDLSAPSATVSITSVNSEEGTFTTTDRTLDIAGTLTGELRATDVIAIYNGTTRLGEAEVTAGNWLFTTESLPLGDYSLNAVVENTTSGESGNSSEVFELSIAIDYTVTFDQTARYVLLVQTVARDYWQLTEVEVFDATGTNLAVNKPVISGDQSLYLSDQTYAVDKVVNGNNVAAGSNRHLATPQNGGLAWLVVDLEDQYQLDEIKLYEGSSSGFDRINNTRILTSSVDFTALGLEEGGQLTAAMLEAIEQNVLVNTVGTIEQSSSGGTYSFELDTELLLPTNEAFILTGYLSTELRTDDTVEIYDGDTLLGVADVNGTAWSFSLDNPTEGVLTVKLVSGGQTLSEENVNIEVFEQVAPEASVSITSVNSFEEGFTTDDQTLELVGSITGALAPNDIVVIFDGETRLGEAAITENADGWSFETDVLEFGSRSFTAVVENTLSGMSGEPTAPFEVSINAVNLEKASRYVLLVQEAPHEWWMMSEVQALDENGVNQALNKTIITGDQTLHSSSFPVSKIVDGNATTTTSSNRYLAAAKDDGLAWLVIDLGDIYSIDEIKLYQSDTFDAFPRIDNTAVYTSSVDFSSLGLEQGGQLTAELLQAIAENALVNQVGVIDQESTSSIYGFDVNSQLLLEEGEAFALTGTLAAELAFGDAIEIHAGEVKLGDAVVTGTTWSYTYETPTDEVLTVKLVSGGSVIVEEPVNVKVYDNIAPTTTVDITTVNDVNASFTTDDQTFELKGTHGGGLRVGDEIVIYDGENRLGTALVSGTDWTFTTDELPLGTVNFIVRVENTLTGLVSENTATFDLNINNVAITTLVADSGSDIGVVATGGNTDDTTPVVVGAIGTALASNQAVAIYSGDTYLGTADIDATGTGWTFNVPEDNALDFGAASLTAQIVTMQDDDVVDTLITSTVREVDVVDLSAPSATVSITSVNSEEGTFTTTDRTLDIAGTLTGELRATDVIAIYNGTTRLGEAEVTENTWSFTTESLPLGDLSLTAVVENTASGESGTASVAFEVSIVVEDVEVVTFDQTSRYVLLVQEVPFEYWQLTEVEVFDATGTNLAVNKPVISGDQSLYLSDQTYAVDKVVNGNNVAAGSNRHLATPQNGGLAWLVVDLEDQYQLDEIKLYEGSSSGFDRINNTKILTSSVDFTALGLEEGGQLTAAMLEAIEQNVLVNTVGTIEQSSSDNSYSFELDTQLLLPEGDEFTLTGTLGSDLAEGYSLKVYAGETELGDADVTGSTWSFTGTVEADVSQITVRLMSGETVISEETVSVTVYETTAPTTTVSIETVNDFGAAFTTDDQTFTLAGTLDAVLRTGDEVVIYDGATRLGTANVTGTGWTFNTAELSLGVVSFMVRVENSITELASDSTATFDLTINSVSVTNVVADSGQSVGVISANGSTDDNTPVVSGTVGTTLGADERVAVFSGETFLGTAIVNGTTWSFNIPEASALALGNNQLTASIVTMNGEEVDQTFISSTARMVNVIDATPPSQTVTISSVADNVGIKQGDLERGDTTDDTTLNLTGRLDAALRDGDVLAVYDGNFRIGEANVTATVWTFTTPALRIGDHTLTARVENPITGNGPVSVAFEANINNVAITTLVADSGSDIGVVATGGNTDDTTPVVVGAIGTALASNQAVAIYSGDTYLGTADIDATGTGWTFNVPEDNALDFGAASLTAQIVTMQDDDVVDTLITSTVREVDVVDLSAPSATVSITSVNSEEGTFTTTDRTLDIAGTLTGELRATDVIAIYNGTTRLGEAEVTENTWSFTTESLPLGDLSLTAVVENTASGESGTASVAFEVSIVVEDVEVVTFDQTSRYVLLVQEVPFEYWQLTEVEVFDATGTNLAVNKPVISGDQSLYLSDQTYAVDKVVNGNNVAAGSNRHLATPQNGGLAWLVVDLEDQYQLDEIKLYEGSSSGFDRINNTKILTSSVDFTALGLEEGGQLTAAMLEAIEQNVLVNTVGTIEQSSSDNSYSFELDTQLLLPEGDEFTLTGTLGSDLAEGYSLKVYAGETELGDADVTGSTWSFTGTVEADVSQITVRLMSGETVISEETVSVTVYETTAPTTTVSIETVNDFGAAFTTDDQTFTLAGTLDAVLRTGDEVVIYDGATRLGTANVTGTGWTFNTAELSLGVVSFMVRVENSITELASDSTATFDLTINSVSVTNVVADSGQSVGVISANGSTDDNTPVVSGTVGTTLGADERVAVFSGETFLGTAIVNGTTWSFNVPEASALALGNNQLTASIVTMNGEEVDQRLISSTERMVNVIDATPPSQTVTISSVADNVGIKQGNLSNGDVTDDTQLALKGVLSGFLEEGQVVAIYDGSSRLGEAQVTANVWLFTTPSLAMGERNLTARVEHPITGNGESSDPFVVTLNSVAISNVVADSGPVTGLVSSDGLTTDSTPIVSGTLGARLSASEKVAVYNGEDFLGFANSGASSWSFKPQEALAAGDYVLSARIVSVDETDQIVDDLIGSATRGFTVIEALPPSAEVSITDVIGADQSIADGGSTAARVLALSGQVDQTLSAVEVVAVYADGIRLGVATVTGQNWTYTTPSLSFGERELTVRVENRLTGDASDPATYTTQIKGVTIESIGKADGTELSNLNSAADAWGYEITDRNAGVNHKNITGILSPVGRIVDLDIENPGNIFTVKMDLPSGGALNITANILPDSVNVDTSGQVSFRLRDTRGFHEFSVTLFDNGAGGVSYSIGNTIKLLYPNNAGVSKMEISGVEYQPLTDDPTPLMQGAIDGSLAANERVALFNGSDLLGFADVEGGTWRYLPTFAFDVNQSLDVTAQIVTVDASDQIVDSIASSSSIELGVAATDTPNQDVFITSVIDNQGAVTGDLAEGGATDDRTPVITGTLSAPLQMGERLAVYAGDLEVGTARVSEENGQLVWTLHPIVQLPVGVSALEAFVLNTATGERSSAATFEINIINNVEITSVVSDAGTIADEVASGGFTDDSTPVITGSLGGELAETEKVAIYNGNTLLGTANVEGTEWAFTPPADLTPGSYTLTARVVSTVLGYVDQSLISSDNFSFTLTAAGVPEQTVAITKVSDNVGVIQGAVDTGAATDDTTLTLTGTLSDSLRVGDVIAIYNGDNRLGEITSVNANEQGAFDWTYTTPVLPFGQQALHVQVENLGSGLTGEASAVFETYINAVSIDHVVDDRSDAGVVADNASTSDTTPVISGTLSTGLRDGDTIKLYANGVALVGDLVVHDTRWSFTPTEALGFEQTELQARIETGGVEWTASANRAVNIIEEIAQPEVTATVTILSASDNVGVQQGLLTSGATSDDTTLPLTGLISQDLSANEVLAVYDGATRLGEASLNGLVWTFTTPNLDMGPRDLTAVVENTVSGEAGTPSDVFAVNVNRLSMDGTVENWVSPEGTVVLQQGRVADIDMSHPDTSVIYGFATDPTSNPTLRDSRIVQLQESEGEITFWASVYEGNHRYVQVRLFDNDAGGVSAEVLQATWNWSSGVTDRLWNAPGTAQLDLWDGNSGRGIYEMRLALRQSIDEDGTNTTLRGTLAAPLVEEDDQAVAIYSGEAFLGFAEVDGTVWSFEVAEGTQSLSAALVVRAGDAVDHVLSKTVDNTVIVTQAVDPQNMETPDQTASVLSVFTVTRDGETILPGGEITTLGNFRVAGIIDQPINDWEVVAVYSGEQRLGTAQLNGIEWSYLTADIGNGEHEFTARVESANGESGAFSDGYTVYTNAVDITRIFDFEGDIKGAVSTTGLTDDQTPVFSGSLRAALPPGAFVEVSLVSGETTVLLGEATVEGLRWDLALTNDQAIEFGEYEVFAQLKTAQGDVVHTTARADLVIIDTNVSLPTATLEAVTDNAGVLLEVLENGATTDDTRPVLSGTLSAPLATGQVLAVYSNDGETRLGEVTATNFNWTFQPQTLAFGEHAFQLRTENIVSGEMGEFTDAWLVNVNHVDIVEVLDNAGSVPGLVSVNGVTDDVTPALNGTLGTALRDGEQIVIYNGDTRLGVAEVDTAALTWSFTPDTSIAFGLNSLNARLEDNSGEETVELMRSDAVNVTVVDTGALVQPDQTLEIVRVLDHVGDWQGTIEDGNTTDDTTLTLQGTVSSVLRTGEAIAVYDGDTLLGQASLTGTYWTFTTPELATGERTLNVVVQNMVSGVQAAVSAEFTANINRVAATDIAFDDTGLQSLSGTLSVDLQDGEALAVYSGDTRIEQEVTVNGTEWSFAPTGVSNAPEGLSVRIQRTVDSEAETVTSAQVLVGDSDADRLIGGFGDDLIVGAGGDDLLTGSAGADTFVFLPGQTGASTVSDFSIDEGDRLDLSFVFEDTSIDEQLSSYFQIETDGVNSTLSVDVTGSQQFDATATTVLIRDVTDLTVEDLIARNALIV